MTPSFLSDFTLRFVIITQTVISGQLSDLKTCGISKEISGDLRTKAPWTTSIFIKPTPNSDLYFFVAGTVIAPTLIITSMQNQNYLHERTKETYRILIPQPDKLVIGVGLKSRFLNETDQHSQFREVSYIEPYLDAQPEQKLYHLVILHLKSPLDLSTPYVNSLCFPTIPKSKREYALARSLFKEYFDVLFNGHNRTLHLDSQGIYQNLNNKSTNNCEQLFKRIYNSDMPIGLYCVQKKTLFDENVCLHQGHPTAVNLFEKRWFTLGMIALKPEELTASCNTESVYFAHVPTFLELKWIRSLLKCPSYHFACTNSTCISELKICNDVKDCVDGTDENETFCKAQGSKLSTNQLDQNTFSEIQLHTPIKPKLSSTTTTTIKPVTETATKSNINKRRISSAQENTVAEKVTTCRRIPTLKGIQMKCKNQQTYQSVNCSSAIPVRTIVTLTCGPFYKSSYSYSSVQIMCLSTGKWHTSKPFSCKQECGTKGSDDPLRSNAVNNKEPNFQHDAPWHAAIFKLSGGLAYYLCGATLIEKSYVLTAAHCLFDFNGFLPPNKNDKYKVILAPNSANFTASQVLRSQTHDVKEFWWPISYNRFTFQSDIALIQLERPITYTKSVRPACILPLDNSKAVILNNTGSVAGFGITENQALSTPLQSTTFTVVPTSQCQLYLGDNTSSTICAIRKSGAALCKGDSGGGLVHQELVGKETRYTVKGVVSHRVKSNQACTLHGPITFTQVDAYRNWIIEMINRSLS